MNQQEIDAFFQASIARRPVPPPPCSHTGLGYYIDYVEGWYPGRALKCSHCHKVLAIKPDLVEEVIVEKPVYVTREVRVHQAGLAEWVLFAALVIGFIVLVVTI